VFKICRSIGWVIFKAIFLKNRLLSSYVKMFAFMKVLWHGLLSV
jgi:hypothetical protein